MLIIATSIIAKLGNWPWCPSVNEENVPVGNGIDITLSKNKEIPFTGKWVELGMRKREGERRRTKERPSARL